MAGRCLCGSGHTRRKEENPRENLVDIQLQLWQVSVCTKDQFVMVHKCTQETCAKIVVRINLAEVCR